jgi:hypothetical protein
LPVPIAVTESLKAAAVAAGIQLLVMGNQYDGEVARRNVEYFIDERVDLVLEFQTDRLVAPIIANELAEAGIPLIAVDSPHPNAVYFGAGIIVPAWMAAISWALWPWIAIKEISTLWWDSIWCVPEAWCKAGLRARLKAFANESQTFRPRNLCDSTVAG